MHHPGSSADGEGWAAETGVKGGTKVKLTLLKVEPGQALLQLVADAKPQVDPGTPVQHLIIGLSGFSTAGGSPGDCALSAVCGIKGVKCRVFCRVHPRVSL